MTVCEIFEKDRKPIRIEYCSFLDDIELFCRISIISQNMRWFYEEKTGAIRKFENVEIGPQTAYKWKVKLRFTEYYWDSKDLNCQERINCLST